MIVAEAPGKLVVLGEYAVLRGAPALVMAVDRRCRAEISPSADERCHLHVSAPESVEMSLTTGSSSGVALVDLVAADASAGASAWRASLDSRSFFVNGTKIGIGSSAAALTVWYAAWLKFHGLARVAPDADSLQRLIRLHRDFQGGSGSGLDVAASLFGGAITYELSPESVPLVGSVGLPNSVRFATVFTGRPASTRNFVAAFDAWLVERPTEAKEKLQALKRVSAQGCVAARENDANALLVAISEYGTQLRDLGEQIGAEIVTAEHRELTRNAAEYGVVYKVSGAGGGDLGIAFSTDSDALDAFCVSVKDKYAIVDLHMDETGLSVEELED